MNNTIAICIPTMNRQESLTRTVECLLKGSRLPNELIICDQSNNGKNGINKKIEQRIHELGIKYTLIIQEQPSSTMARNRCIESAESSIIIFSDDDVDVKENTLENIYCLFEDRQINLVAALDDNMPNSKIRLGYLFGTKSWKKRGIGHVTNSVLARYPEKVEGIAETEWAMGYFFAVRTDFIKTNNIYFDENLKEYAYAEDLDFSYRYCKKSKDVGAKCVLSNTVVVSHLQSQEYRIPSRKNTFMYICNREYIGHKNNIPNYGIASSWSNFWMFIYRLLKRMNYKDYLDALKCLRNNKAEIRSGRLNYEKWCN